MTITDSSPIIDYIKRAQAANGSFMGEASFEPSNFSQSTQRPTLFFTALIMDCLKNIHSCKQIQKRAATYLLKQRSQEWTWNYWPRDAAISRSEPYPDDLDDTACVLAALDNWNEDVIDGTALGMVARTLVRVESATGGPYRTWLTDNPNLPAWDNIDIAVNANIGYFLSLRGVRLANLEDYISESIQINAIQSLFYVDSEPTIYFLSRWYSGAGIDKIRKYIKKRLATPELLSALKLALLISAGCRLGIPKQLLKDSVGSLEQLRQGDHWPAEAFYFEPLLNGNQRFAGSKTLTTAFALEACILFSGLKKTPAIAKHSTQAQTVFEQALVLAKQLKSHDLLQLLQEYLTNISTMEKSGQQITALANLMSRATQKEVEPSCLSAFNLGSLFGWVAYSIYDDFLDAEGQPEQLNLANWCHRQAISSFRSALTRHPNFERKINDAFDRMDAANAWELRHARGVVRANIVTISRLPNYRDHKLLANRSWGHQLAASGVLVATGLSIYSHAYRAFSRFFEHFLIARQLHDDAHDWENDLQKGHLTAVVTMLLSEQQQPAKAINLTQEIAALRLHFWQQTISSVTALINHHITVARRELKACTYITEPDPFIDWLDHLQQGAQIAMSERQQAQNFITSYAPQELVV